MMDFGAFCYLDVPKSGSTFVNRFLKRHSRLPLVHGVKHAAVRWPEPEGGDGRLYFITCRDPVAQWRSLYFYGCDGKGALHNFIRQHHPELAAFYDGTEAGLNAWLGRLLAPDFAVHMPEGYDRAAPALYGFQTFRFLKRSFRKPMPRLRDLATRDDLLAAYDAHRLHAHVLRNESLNADLAALLQGDLAPYIRDMDAAMARLARKRRVNASSHRRARRGVEISDEMRALIRSREWFFYDVLGYP